ncbi:hypothetical protein [Arsenophonus nasoniae]|uniref:Uncharacterized protein n=1 Tax=Arsenophonus nasoniae TaxID=638 RepID=A0AA95GRZ2_9GAMM|nr:hypothetical protein [Arsenophonus nasoniae]WGM02936.1 hypothetical protein QE210_07680 [Arsenophonus nasoniae]
MTQITVIKRSNYAQRRYERRAAFLAKKRQEAEQKCQVRSTEQILDSIFNKQDDTVNTIASLTLNLKDKKPQPSFDNCCLPKSTLYSVKNKYRQPILESRDLTARV